LGRYSGRSHPGFLEGRRTHVRQRLSLLKELRCLTLRLPNSSMLLWALAPCTQRRRIFPFSLAPILPKHQAGCTKSLDAGQSLGRIGCHRLFQPPWGSPSTKHDRRSPAPWAAPSYSRRLSETLAYSIPPRSRVLGAWNEDRTAPSCVCTGASHSSTSSLRRP
jgi:hypothetical protein